MNTNDPIVENEEDIVREEGKRFPDEERPKLPWEDEPEKSGKRRKQTAWERFGNVDAFCGKIMICDAVMGVIADRVLKRGRSMKRRRLERERREKERLEREKNRSAAEKEAKEETRKVRRAENWVMAGSVIGCLLIAVIMNMCFGADVSYGGQRGWAGGHQDVRLGMALIFGPCVGGIICRMMRRYREKKK